MAIAAALLVVCAAVAFATTATHTQNPQFRVTVSIAPAHPEVGDTVVATFRITNTTSRTLHGEWQFSFSTPSSGLGAAVAGALPPGKLAGETLRRRVRATSPTGSYSLFAEASDARGSSHARIQVTVG